MTKEEFIANYNNIVYIIKNYCLENNKSEEDIKLLFTLLNISPDLLVPIYNKSLDYYTQKYDLKVITYNKNIIKIY